jgi:hypothetical protein
MGLHGAEKHTRNAHPHCICVFVSHSRVVHAFRFLQALQRCAVSYAGGAAAHVRVFLPQWAYFARSAAAGGAHLRARAAAGALFIGTTEAFDASLALLARWAGWGLPSVSYASRQRQYNARHPTPDEWAPAERDALTRALARSGDADLHADALALWAAQAAAYEERGGGGGGRGEEGASGHEGAEEGVGVALARDTAALRARNAAPRSEAEREADRALRRKRHRPPGPNKPPTLLR